jgi:arabinoxylan arabinofuranohydrolase
MNKNHLINRQLFFLLLVVFFSGILKAQNPFLPPWEYIPDGEPRVFGDRVYIYGSHDKAGSTTFCDTKYVVWSAPLDTMTNWRLESESFYSKADEHGIDNVSWSDNDLYAPDVVEKDGKYYLYVYIVGAPGCIAVSDVPGGPFSLVSQYQAPAGAPSDFGGWGQYIDPGVLVDDDGRVFIYWGYHHSHMAEINPENMYEILPDSYQADIIPAEAPFRFFEGASIRKINGTYYLIYAQGSSLAYATSTSPTGPFEYGGVIIRNGNNYPGGNIHGSLCEINGQWYIFYHRMTHNTIMSRKACAERVTIKSDGSIDEVDMTSLGFRESLNPYELHSPYTACVLTGGNYIIEIDSFTHPVIRNKHESVIGFKYFDFTTDTVTEYTRFTAGFRNTEISGEMEVWIDSPNPDEGRKIGFIDVIKPTENPNAWREIDGYIDTVSGIRALYFKFISDEGDGLIGDLKSFTFSKTDDPIANPPNNRPYATKKIADYSGYKTDSDSLGVVNLKDIFYDIEDTTALSFSIANNSNPAIVTPDINSNGMLDLSFSGSTGGISRITIKATDTGGKSGFASFKVYLLDPDNPNKAFAQKSIASSAEGDNYLIENINDGDRSTRWSSSYNDNQSVVFELDSAYLIKKLLLYWEYASGKDYEIQVSDDGISWNTVSSVSNSDGGTDKVIIEGDVTSKFVKLNLQVRNTPYGFSLWEVEIYEDESNEAPLPTAQIDDQTIQAGSVFTLDLPDNLFTDDGDSLSYYAMLSDGNPLPSWINFDAVDLEFSGTPSVADTGIFPLRVKAIDSFGAEGVIDFLVTVLHSPSSINNRIDAERIEMYPNPAQDRLFIITSGIEVNQVSIIDITGKVVMMEQVNNQMDQLPYEITLSLSEGFYVVKLKSPQQVFTKTLFVCDGK